MINNYQPLNQTEILPQYHPHQCKNLPHQDLYSQMKDNQSPVSLIENNLETAYEKSPKVPMDKP